MATYRLLSRGPGTGEPQQRLREEETIHQFRSPFGKRTGGVMAGWSASRMDESPAGWRAVTGSCQRFTALVAKSLVTARMQDGVRGTSSRCGSGFAKQMAGNVEKREAPTFFRHRIQIRLDENLDGLFAGINLDTKGRVAEIDLVSSSVFSSNYGVGHWVWLSEIGDVGLPKWLSGGRSRDVSGHFPSINQI
jgi:hypothetical protein